MYSKRAWGNGGYILDLTPTPGPHGGSVRNWGHSVESYIVLHRDRHLGGDHLILRGGGGWHFLEINILTLKMLEINNLSSSGKNINNLTLAC